MTLTVRGGTNADLDFIFFNMWTRGADEYGDPGSTERADILEAFKKFPRNYFFTFCDDNEPIAAFGAVPLDGYNIYGTWFAATEDFLKTAFAATLFIRRFIKETVRRDGIILRLFSKSKHPETDHWFRILGFHFVHEEDGVKHYRYDA